MNGLTEQDGKREEGQAAQASCIIDYPAGEFHVEGENEGTQGHYTANFLSPDCSRGGVCTPEIREVHREITTLPSLLQLHYSEALKANKPVSQMFAP